MLIHNKQVTIYDIEIFPNVFHCVCKNTETGKIDKFEISSRKVQIEELVNFFLQKDILICGYNNHHYDDIVINYILDYSERMKNMPVFKVCDSLFNLSQIIVTGDNEDVSKFKKWKYANYFDSMDILTMMFSSKLRIGLKEMQLTMHYPNVLEYHGDFNSFLQTDDIDDMIFYNINDVESTEQLLNILSSKGEIDLRLFLEKEYGFNALSMDSVKFGETLLERECAKAMNISVKQLREMRSPMDYIPLKDVILPCISYKNQILKDVLEDMKKQVVYAKERIGYE